MATLEDLRPPTPHERAFQKFVADCRVDKDEATGLLDAAQTKIAKLPLGDVRQIQALRGLRDCAEILRSQTAAAQSLYHRLANEAHDAADEAALTLTKTTGTPLHRAVLHVLLNPQAAGVPS
jgi:hypothetical protein